MRFQIRAHAAPWNQAIELLIRCGKMTGVMSGMEMFNGELNPQSAIRFEELDIGRAPEPSLSISMTDAQTLMDDLWQAGLRPTEGTGSAGSLAATERHLQDMRRLVFDSERKGL